MAENNFFGVKKGLRFKPSTLPATGNLGEITYDSSTNTFKQWTGTVWDEISGSGGVGINYLKTISKGNTTSGFVVSKNTSAAALPDSGFVTGSTNITITSSVSGPLRETNSLVISKDAANRQGEQVYYNFSIDSADQGKILQFSMDYNIASGTYVDDDAIAYIYDVTNASFIEPVPFKIKNHMLASERFYFQFATNSNSTNYRLIFHIASTSASAYSLKLDNLILGPNPRSVATNTKVQYYNTVSAITGVTTVTADTPVDVTNATLTLTEPGDYELIYESYIAISSANGERVGVNAKVMITDSSNVVIDESYQIVTASPALTGRTFASPVRSVAKVTITSATTYKVRLVHGESAANSTAQTGFQEITGSLTGNDGGSKFYARRIVTTQHQILDDGYATREILAVAVGDPTLATSGNPFIFPTVRIDKVSGYSAVSGQYTVKSAGTYEIILNSGTTGGSAGTVYSYKNGVQGDAAGAYPGGSAPLTAYALIDCKAGDVIDMRPNTSVDITGGTISFKRIPNPAQVVQPLIQEYTEQDKQTNYIINSDMNIFQRTESAVSGLGAVIQYHADRFAWAAGTITGQVRSEKVGVVVFSNSNLVPKTCDSMNRYEVTTAQASLNADSTAGPWYKMEGYDFKELINNGALTRGITLSFYVASSVTGTYTIEFTNSATNNRYFKTYTINSANTWQRVSMHLTAAEINAGISSGTWDYANGVGLLIRFWLAAGTNTNGGTQNAWTGSTPNVPASQVNFLGTIGNLWGYTGIMVNVGNVVPDFRTRQTSYGEEVDLCRRYYEKSYDLEIAVGTNTTVGREDITDRAISSGATDGTSISFKVNKRTSSTVSVWTQSGTLGQLDYAGSGSGTGTASVSTNGRRGINVALTGGAGLTINTAVHLRFHWAADAEL